MVAYQAAVAVGRVRANQFRPANAEWDAFVAPDLWDQVHAGDDFSGSGVLNDGEIIRAHGRVIAAQQVSRPDADPGLGFIRTAVDAGVEFTEGGGIRRSAAAQDQAVTEVSEGFRVWESSHVGLLNCKGTEILRTK